MRPANRTVAPIPDKMISVVINTTFSMTAAKACCIFAEVNPTCTTPYTLGDMPLADSPRRFNSNGSEGISGNGTLRRMIGTAKS